MSEKRFTFYYERGNEVVIKDSGKRLSNKQLVDLLNEMSDENGQLKEESEQLQKVCSHLKKENKSLIENIFDIYEKVKWVSK